MDNPDALGTTAPLVREEVFLSFAVFASYQTLLLLSHGRIALWLEQKRMNKQTKIKHIKQKIEIFPHCLCRVTFMFFLVINRRLILDLFPDGTWYTVPDFGLILSSAGRNPSGGGKRRKLTAVLVAFWYLFPFSSSLLFFPFGILGPLLCPFCTVLVIGSERDRVEYAYPMLTGTRNPVAYSYSHFVMEKTDLSEGNFVLFPFVLFLLKTQ